MALTQNTALRTVLADCWADAFDGGTLEIRTVGGTTLLASITLPNPAFGPAVNGVVNKLGSWNDISANATGVARVGRLISVDTLKVCNVTITQSGGGGDMIISNENVVLSGAVSVLTFAYSAP